MYGKTCDKCKGINHFKAVCRSKVTAQDGAEPSPKQEVTAAETWFHGEATVAKAKEVATVNTRRRKHPRSH